MDLKRTEPEVKISRIVKPLPTRIKNAIAVLLGKADIAPPLYQLTVPERKSLDEINAAIRRATKVWGLTISTSETVSPFASARPEQSGQSPD
jgi:hypothetical protein